MPTSVFDTIQSLTNGEFIRTTARQLGESDSAVAGSLTTAAATLLMRLSRLSDDAAVMTRVASLIDPPGAGEGGRPRLATAEGGGYMPPPIPMPGNASSTVARLGRGTALLTVVFATRLAAVADALAEETQMSPISARAVLGHAAPLVLKALGLRLDHTSLEPIGMAPTGSQLAELLDREDDAFVRAVPDTILAVLDTEEGTPTPREAVAVPSTQRATEGTQTAALPVGPRGSGVLRKLGAGILARTSEMEGTTLGTATLFGGLTVLVILWWIFLPGYYAPYSLRVDPAVDVLGRSAAARPGRGAAVPLTGPGTQAGGTFAGPSSSTPSTMTAPAAVTGLLRLIKKTLPSNKQIDYIEDGIEGRMIALIENRGRPLERTEWFEFDRLNFQTGSSNLTTDSRAQVQNIADILASYPTVKIKIGGYTDNVGEPAANQRLSEARAQRVMTELITLGVNALRLEAEGYGDLHPIADNSTSEGRAKNRRIAVRVLER